MMDQLQREGRREQGGEREREREMVKIRRQLGKDAVKSCKVSKDGVDVASNIVNSNSNNGG